MPYCVLYNKDSDRMVQYCVTKICTIDMFSGSEGTVDLVVAQ